MGLTISKTKGRVLIVDNRPDHIVWRRKALEQAGYDMREAHTAAETKSILANWWVPLVILDVRLEDDQNEYDRSGLKLAEELDPSIFKIMLTVEEHFKVVQEAYEKANVIAYIVKGKGEGLEELVNKVDQAFGDKIRINTDLKIQFELPLTLIGTMAAIDSAIDAESHRRDKLHLVPLIPDVAELADHANELADLFRMLFHDREKITLYPYYSGRGGSSLLLVKPENDGSPQEMVILKVGERSAIETEARNFDMYATKLIGSWTVRKQHPSNKPSQNEPTAKTLHYAGISYTAAGGRIDFTERFRDFYRGTTNPDQICDVLSNLFGQMDNWFKSTRVEPIRLDAFYQNELELNGSHHSRTKFQEALQEICRDAPNLPGTIRIQNGKISFTFGDQTWVLPLPTSFVYDRRLGIPPMTHQCITHGDFHADNLLVDKRAHGVWLVDFSRTGWGPTSRDFAELETTIKLDLIRTDNFHSLHLFEKQLLSCRQLDEPIVANDTLPEDLRTAIKVISHLRSIATSKIPDLSLQAYFIGLLFYSAWMIVSGGSSPPSIGQSRPVIVRKAHALLSAAVLCEQLDKRKGDNEFPLPLQNGKKS